MKLAAGRGRALSAYPTVDHALRDAAYLFAREQDREGPTAERLRRRLLAFVDDYDRASASAGEPLQVSTQGVLSREQMIELFKLLSTLVVSLDRLGSAHADASRERLNEATVQFLLEWGMFRRLAAARGLLGDALSAGLSEEEELRLEDELNDHSHWTPASPRPPGAA